MMQGTLGEDILFDFNKPQLEFDESVPAWIFRVQGVFDLSNLWSFYWINAMRGGKRGLSTFKVIWDYENPDKSTQTFEKYESKMVVRNQEYLSTLSQEEAEREFIVYVTLIPVDENNSLGNILDLGALNFLSNSTEANKSNHILSISHTNVLRDPSQHFYIDNFEISFALLGTGEIQTIQEFGEQPFFTFLDSRTENNRFNYIQYCHERTSQLWSPFADCTHLTRLPENLFADYDTTRVSSVSIYNFCGGCTSLKRLPSKLFEPFKNTNLVELRLYNSFEHTGITDIPAGFLKDIDTNTFAAYNLFKNCPNLTDVRSDVFENCGRTAIDLNYNFQNCTGLKNIETALTKCCGDNYEKNIINLQGNFDGCVNVTGKLPELWNIYDNLWEEYGTEIFKGSCFAGCEQADNYQEAVDHGWA